MQSDPASDILQIAGGFCLARCLHVVADLGVADAIDDAPKTAVELAGAVGAHPGALERTLRLLAAHGVFSHHTDGYGHSPASRLLRTDHPRSLRAFARMFGLSVMWSTAGALGRTIRTGEPGAEQVHPGGFWSFLEAHPDANAIFNAAMAGKAHGQVAAVAGACDFTRFRLIADIGGGRGHLLRAVLDAAPHARGILFDLPRVVAECPPSDRLALQAGDFFRDVLPTCDAYLLMEVIHDWADPEAATILRAIRRAAAPGASLLLIEQIIPDIPGPHWTKTLDLHMLALFGGRQRTRAEYATLLNEAGFRLRREVDSGAGVSILEATAA